MIQKYPFIIFFYKAKVYGYFPDIKKIVIKTDLVSTCLFYAEHELGKEMKKYKYAHKSTPMANHISYYKKYDYVTYIEVNV